MLNPQKEPRNEFLLKGAQLSAPASASTPPAKPLNVRSAVAENRHRRNTHTAYTRTHTHTHTHTHTQCALWCGHRQVQILSPSNGAIYTDTEVLGASAGSASARPSGSLARAGDDSPGWLCRARTARPAHRARSVTFGSTSATASSECATPNRAGFRRLVCAPAAAHRELWCDRVCRRHS